MIARYCTQEMVEIWGDERRFRSWLEVEVAVLRALARRGTIPPEVPDLVANNARVDAGRIREIEKTTRHDVVAFTTCLAESLGPESRWVHFGLTSTDVVDTAQALVLRDAVRVLEAELAWLSGVMKEQAFRHKHTLMAGRTHGIHAEPASFGLKFAVWHAEMERNAERLRAAAKDVVCGKISGAVGTFAHLSPEIEEEVCRDLGISFAPASTQTLQRDRHAHFVAVLGIIAGTLEKVALEVRHLQRTEVREAEEPFRKGQKGSSAMPHKRNPVRCEQVCGLARVVRAHAITAMENQALWHERDISHSSAERVILPDSTTLVHYMARSLKGVLSDLDVYPETMLANLDLSRGLVYSGQLLLALAAKGALREEAYEWVQRDAMEAWGGGDDFACRVRRDPAIARFLSPEELDPIFDARHYLRHVDAIFKRVFGLENGGGCDMMTPSPGPVAARSVP